MSPRRFHRPEDFTAKLGDADWQIKFVRRCDIQKDRLGDCNWDKKLIRVRFDLEEDAYVDTLLHELQHALSLRDYHSEEWVTMTSTEIATVMLRAGIGRKGKDAS
jgi:hypothetical protein